MRYKGLGQSLKVRIANSCLPAELKLLLDKSSHLGCLAHQYVSPSAEDTAADKVRGPALPLTRRALPNQIERIYFQGFMMQAQIWKGKNL